MSGFSEVTDGIWHWSAPHPGIGQVVHSYLVPGSGLAIDPIWIDGLDREIEDRGGITRVALTNRHHLRGAERLQERLGCEILAPALGMHEFGEGDAVKPYEWGTEVAPGVTAHEVGAICPDDGALLINRSPGALALADAVISWDGKLSFVPDFLMDEPERVKAATIDALAPLLELDFDALLLAHGEPIATGGKDALREFVGDPRQADFSL